MSLPVRAVDLLPRLPSRDPESHKGTFGSVGILAGSQGMLGAAILCARGALRGGAGLVQACLPEEFRSPFTVAVPAATTLARPQEIGALFERATSLVLGPGLGVGDEAKEQVFAALAMGRSDQPMVVDADALNLLAPLGGAVVCAAPLILTPHPGEAARLLETSSAKVQSDRRAAVVQLARCSGQVVVLKGQGSLVCDGEALFENRTGNPGLATGGSGDVLAGLLAALLAQGMSSFEAACLAVDVHGRAGDLVASRLSQSGLCAEDLPLAIAEVMQP